MSRSIVHAEEESEGALLLGRRINQFCLAHLTKSPGLNIVLPPGEKFKVVINTLVLEEKRLIAPERESNRACHHDASDEVAARAGKLMNWVGVGEYFEEDGTGAERRKLVREVFLPRIGPAVDVVGLELEDEGPAGLLFNRAILLVLRPIQHAHCTNVIRSLG